MELQRLHQPLGREFSPDIEKMADLTLTCPIVSNHRVRLRPKTQSGQDVAWLRYAHYPDFTVGGYVKDKNDAGCKMPVAQLATILGAPYAPVIAVAPCEMSGGRIEYAFSALARPSGKVARAALGQFAAWAMEEDAMPAAGETDVEATAEMAGRIRHLKPGLIHIAAEQLRRTGANVPYKFVEKLVMRRALFEQPILPPSQAIGPK